MLCPNCMTYVSNSEPTCPVCGVKVDHTRKDEGVLAIRQGLHARDIQKAAASDAQAASKEESSRRRPKVERGASRVYQSMNAEEAPADIPLYGVTGEMDGYSRLIRQAAYEPENGSRRKMRKDHKLHKVSDHMVNWVVVGIVILVILVMMLVGAFMYLRMTDGGQIIMARMGYDASAPAMWTVGEEFLDVGDIDRAIELFEKARALEEEAGEGINVDGLLILGSAYEAAGDLEKAEELYTDLYTNVVPTRAEPYRNMIRILQNTGRNPEAAELMQLAYEKTGVASFQNARIELLPSAPNVDIVAGYYTVAKRLTLTCDPGCDIYYTVDENAELPQDGILYTEPILLEEGVYSLRAVAVKGDLVSDTLRGTWKIIMPSPQKPGCNVAPNTYKKPQSVRLRPGEDNKNDKDITIYYTIDGSIPDEDSPVWDGTPIKLPNGRVYLRAVAVNGYGKSSNMLEVFYKIEAKPWPQKMMTSEDVISNLNPGTTTRVEFEIEYGQGTGEKEEYTMDGVDQAEKVHYSWGYAIFGKKASSVWILYGIYYTGGNFKAPRKTGLGQSMNDIVSAYCDMGQVASPSGNRGLYADGSDSGKILKQEDGTRIVRYRCSSTDGHTWQLCYYINKGGTCNAIGWTWLR